MSDWKQKSAPTIEVKIFIAGDMQGIRDICRAVCEKGFCVSVKQTEFIYKFGMETGAEITLINYPRFPAKTADDLLHIARILGEAIAGRCSQGSYTIQGPKKTEFFSRRDFD